MSWFADVKPVPPDPVLGLSEAFAADLRKKKLNLTIGTYRDEHLQPFIFQAVKKAEEQLWSKETSKEYLPMAGDARFLEKLGEFVFRPALWARYRKQIASAQTAGGTGALRLAGEFLRSIYQSTIYISEPTWPNHRHVMQQSGFHVATYPYHDKKHHKVKFDELYAFCETLAPSSILLLQVSCHNPTGCDLTVNEWKALSQLMLKKKLLALFDCAYQGFGENIDRDMEAVRIFIEDGHEFLLAYSCSKIFSLYCERAGALFVFTQGEETRTTILSALRMKTRALLSNPPAHGARVVGCILDTPALYASWEMEMDIIRARMASMRRRLVEVLGEEYDFIRKEKGLFCITGLTAEQVQHLQTEYGIYMTLDGRINLAGLNEEAIGLLGQAFELLRKR